ncbi:MAG: hypothetical protein ACKN9U_10105, partial [Pirellulaceae bacterium]
MTSIGLKGLAGKQEKGPSGILPRGDRFPFYGLKSLREYRRPVRAVRLKSHPILAEGRRAGTVVSLWA